MKLNYSLGCILAVCLSLSASAVFAQPTRVIEVLLTFDYPGEDNSTERAQNVIRAWKVPGPAENWTRSEGSAPEMACESESICPMTYSWRARDFTQFL